MVSLYRLAIIIAALAVSGTGWATQIVPTGYSYPVGPSNGGGGYIYGDDACGQTGHYPTPLNCPTGGDLTDGVLQTVNYNGGGPSAFPAAVGWTVGSAPDPSVSFDFATVETFTGLRLLLENDTDGAIFVPGSVAVSVGGSPVESFALTPILGGAPEDISGSSKASESIGWYALTLASPTAGSVIDIQLNHSADRAGGFNFIFLSEVEFFAEAIPTGPLAALLPLAALALLSRRP